MSRSWTRDPDPDPVEAPEHRMRIPGFGTLSKRGEFVLAVLLLVVAFLVVWGLVALGTLYTGIPDS